MPNLSNPLLLLSVVILCRISACGGDDSEAGLNSKDTNSLEFIDGAGGISCTNNTQCDGGQVCRDGWCRIACADSNECAAPVAVCDNVLGFCVECVTSDDCPESERCDQRACAFYCTEHEHCGTGTHCDTTTGSCVPNECQTNAECQGGFRCSEFACVPIDSIVCEPLSEKCIGQAIRVCNEDGTAYTEIACSGICVDNTGTAECRALVCTPNELGCDDTSTAFVCDATGTVREAISCDSSQYCDGGVCRDQVCSPNTTRCEGEAIAEPVNVNETKV